MFAHCLLDSLCGLRCGGVRGNMAAGMSHLVPVSAPTCSGEDSLASAVDGTERALLPPSLQPQACEVCSSGDEGEGAAQAPSSGTQAPSCTRVDIDLPATYVLRLAHVEAALESVVGEGDVTLWIHQSTIGIEEVNECTCTVDQ